jgi:hypothetical protein
MTFTERHRQQDIQLNALPMLSMFAEGQHREQKKPEWKAISNCAEVSHSKGF